MTLRVEVELLHGTFRASSADDLAALGEDDSGEWPPSPARLFSALVAADGTGNRCRVSSGEELEVLAAAPPPAIVASPSYEVQTSFLRPRFVVVDTTQPGTAQGYPARSAAEVKPSPRQSPRDPHVSYIWPDLPITDEQFASIALRCARVGYLGCADSPARLSAHRGDLADTGGGRARWLPSASDRAMAILPVPFAGMVAALDQSYADFVAGRPVRRSWSPTRRQGYTDRAVSGRPTLFTLRLRRPLPGRRAVTVTHHLRRAVLATYGEVTGADAPPIVTGHGFDGSGFEPVLWLALPNVGHEYSDGRLHGVGAVVPVGAPEAVAGGISAALGAVASRGLRTPGGLIELLPADEASTPRSAQRRTWTVPSERWASALPVVHETWSKHGVSPQQVAQWCRHAGVPEPVDAVVAKLPLVPGGVQMQPSEVRRPRHDERRPYSHLVLTFREQVSGPIVLGRGRTYGLGLMAPFDGRRQGGDW